MHARRWWREVGVGLVAMVWLLGMALAADPAPPEPPPPPQLRWQRRVEPPFPAAARASQAGVINDCRTEVSFNTDGAAVAVDVSGCAPVFFEPIREAMMDSRIYSPGFAVKTVIMFRFALPDAQGRLAVLSVPGCVAEVVDAARAQLRVVPDAAPDVMFHVRYSPGWEIDCAAAEGPFGTVLVRANTASWNEAFELVSLSDKLSRRELGRLDRIVSDRFAAGAVSIERVPGEPVLVRGTVPASERSAEGERWVWWTVAGDETQYLLRFETVVPTTSDEVRRRIFEQIEVNVRGFQVAAPRR